MITHVVGCRPNFIKCAPVRVALNRYGAKQRVIHTGQHYDVHMDLMDDADVSLGLHTQEVWKMARELSRILGDEIVVVYGDTNSSMAGAIAARGRIAHVEAGLRCGDLSMQEERNRRAIDGISSWNFCPDKRAVDNLLTKGEFGPNAYRVGDVMYDVWLQCKHTPTSGDHNLLTIHRAEHYDKNNRRLVDLFKGMLTRIRDRLEGTILFPAHPRILKDHIPKGYEVVPPMNHDEFLRVLMASKAVITDSGGVSKEAVWAKKPLYVLRDVSEWGLPTIGHWGDNWNLHQMNLDSGDGIAAERIAKILATADDMDLENRVKI